MYRSVGKLCRSETITLRAGASAAAMASAADSTLNRLTLVESVTTSSPARAPTRRAILSPTRCGSSIQPALFHLRMSPSPHSRRTTCATRSGAARGSTPSELPSR